MNASDETYKIYLRIWRRQLQQLSFNDIVGILYRDTMRNMSSPKENGVMLVLNFSVGLIFPEKFF